MSDEINKLENEMPKAEPPSELAEVALDQVVGGAKTASKPQPTEFLKIKMTDVY
jgi:hypothetical protein